MNFNIDLHIVNFEKNDVSFFPDYSPLFNMSSEISHF